MIPQEEVDRFYQALSEAFQSADQGERDRASRLLREGAHQAHRVEAPWARELDDLWYRGVEMFRRRYRPGGH